MTKLSFSMVFKTTAGLALTALAQQSSGHALDGARRISSRDARTPLRHNITGGDWRPAVKGDSAPAGLATQVLNLQLPTRTNITHPVTQPAATGLTVIALSGCSYENYIAPMTVANTSTFQVIVDSGSTTAAVAGSRCGTCDVSPKFSPGNGATDTDEPVQAQYGSGSWDGEIYSGTLRLGNGPVATVLFGDITDQDEWFSGGNCLADGNPDSPALNQGIMGVGPASLALEGTDSYFAKIAADLANNSYTVALCDAGGTMWLGGYDARAVNGSMVQLPMTQSNYYSVDMTGIQVGGQDIGVTDSDLGPAVVDTGTSLMILPDSVFSSVVRQIVAGSGNHLDADFFNGETCIALPAGVSLDTVDSELPSLTLTFGNNDNISSGGGDDPYSDPYDYPDYGDYDGFTAATDVQFAHTPPPPAEPLWGQNPPSGSPSSPPSSGSSVASLTFSPTGSYLVPMLDSQGRITVCPGIASAGQEDTTILGNTLMHNNVVVFDVAGQQVGWAQGKDICAS